VPQTPEIAVQTLYDSENAGDGSLAWASQLLGFNDVRTPPSDMQDLEVEVDTYLLDPTISTGLLSYWQV